MFLVAQQCLFGLILASFFFPPCSTDADVKVKHAVDRTVAIKGLPDKEKEKHTGKDKGASNCAFIDNESRREQGVGCAKKSWSHSLATGCKHCRPLICTSFCTRCSTRVSSFRRRPTRQSFATPTL
eukprot:m.204734 g.204734  ORF g.204734 m.204734 type:complete len:126 (-) comp18473_c0_seq14:1473-1850(-)